MPFSGNDRASSFTILGQPPLPRGSHPVASHMLVTSDYFLAMRTSLLAGRVFNSFDTKESPPVVVVNEAFVRKFLSGRNAIGQHIVLDENDDKTTTLEIIGGVASLRNETR